MFLSIRSLVLRKLHPWTLTIPPSSRQPHPSPLIPQSSSFINHTSKCYPYTCVCWNASYEKLNAGSGPRGLTAVQWARNGPQQLTAPRAGPVPSTPGVQVQLRAGPVPSTQGAQGQPRAGPVPSTPGVKVQLRAVTVPSTQGAQGQLRAGPVPSTPGAQVQVQPVLWIRIRIQELLGSGSGFRIHTCQYRIKWRQKMYRKT